MPSDANASRTALMMVCAADLAPERSPEPYLLISQLEFR